MSNIGTTSRCHFHVSEQAFHRKVFWFRKCPSPDLESEVCLPFSSNLHSLMAYEKNTFKDHSAGFSQVVHFIRLDAIPSPPIQA